MSSAIAVMRVHGSICTVCTVHCDQCLPSGTVMGEGQQGAAATSAQHSQHLAVYDHLDSFS